MTLAPQTDYCQQIHLHATAALLAAVLQPVGALLYYFLQ
jgi:hypothetical protein